MLRVVCLLALALGLAAAVSDDRYSPSYHFENNNIPKGTMTLYTHKKAEKEGNIKEIEEKEAKLDYAHEGDLFEKNPLVKEMGFTVRQRGRERNRDRLRLFGVGNILHAFESSNFSKACSG